MRKVGAFEAKTHLSRLLACVEAGETIVITRHGKEIAHLTPPASTQRRPDVAQAVARLREARKGVRLGDDPTIRDLINEGRR